MNVNRFQFMTAAIALANSLSMAKADGEVTRQEAFDAVRTAAMMSGLDSLVVVPFAPDDSGMEAETRAVTVALEFASVLKDLTDEAHKRAEPGITVGDLVRAAYVLAGDSEGAGAVG